MTMLSPDPGLPSKRRGTRRPARVRLTIIISGGSGAAAISVLLARHVQLFPDAGAMAEIAAVILLIAFAVIVLTESAVVVAHAWLRYRAAKNAVDTAKRHDQAIKTYRLLESFSPAKRLSALLDSSGGQDEDEEDGA
jgi:hypothetical protein